MKTYEVNSNLIGKRVRGISFGNMVTGTVTEIEDNESAVCVYFDYDTPQYWGDCIYRKGSNWARKADEFGSLHYLELI